MTGLTDLPVELFLDHLFPLLSISALLNLSCTNRFFHELGSDEPFWHRRLQEDFNFSGSETARKSGWKFLYSRLSHPRVFVWGEKGHGRLGLHPNVLSRITMPLGVPYPVQLHISGVRIVNLVAGGMSFHALDSRGDIYVWGVLNGAAGALRSDGYAIPSKAAETPMRLSLPVKFRSISCGRLHSTALDAASQVWTFTSWGRPFKLVSHLLDKSSAETTAVQIESGWGFSSVLTESGDVLVYWPSIGRMKEAVDAKNEELDEQSATVQTRALPTDQEPHVVPCYAWDLQGVDPVRLPPIRSDQLPRLTDTGLSDQQLDGETKLVKIAGMDSAIIGLTNKGHVLMYGSLGGEDSYQNGHWIYLPHFSEVDKVRAHPTFATSAPEGDPSPEPPETIHITHISAHFQTFVAYSTGERSVVLMGRPPTTSFIVTGHTAEPLVPIVLPALQNRGIISVVLGDYHYGALTDTGKLLTWGAFSLGALGLGDPAKIPVGQPGGFRDDAQRQRSAARRYADLRSMPPPEVSVPTEVMFDHGEKKKKREKYCFAAAAAGWHMGALVIDLEPNEEDSDDEGALDMPGAFPADDETHPPSSGGGGLPQAPGEYPMLPFGRGNHFRIGFAGRGMRRGTGGRGRG